MRVLVLALMAVAAVALGYGTYRLYGVWAAPVPAILIGLAVWERTREKRE